MRKFSLDSTDADKPRKRPLIEPPGAAPSKPSPPDKPSGKTAPGLSLFAKKPAKSRSIFDIGPSSAGDGGGTGGAGNGGSGKGSGGKGGGRFGGYGRPKSVGGRFLKSFLLMSVLLLVAASVIALVGGYALYRWADHDLPSFKNITEYNPPLVSTVYTRDGQVLGHLYREQRFLVRLNEIPQILVDAFLAAEDADFYTHPGVDLMAIVRATLRNILAGSVHQGGSTITQQIIKKKLLTPEKKIERKVKEAILAYRLSNYLTKDEVLTIYLNEIYLGARSYGVEAAARNYFGKHVGQLSLAEAAVIAGLPPAPSAYDPWRNPGAAKVRQKYVLSRMLELGKINKEQHDAALAEPTVLKTMADNSWKQGAYYLEEVRRRLIDYLSFDNMKRLGIKLDRYGEDAVYEGGLSVYTAVDMSHQVAAEKALQHGLEASEKRRGWEGPIKKLKPSEFQSFLASEPVPAILSPGEWIKGVVVEVDKSGAVLAFGNRRGRIDVAQMEWCRKPDPTIAPEAAPKIRDATKVLEVGDVVHASVLDPVEEAKAAKEREQKEREAAEKAEGVDPNKKKKPAPEKPKTEHAGLVKLALQKKPKVQGALVSLEPDNGEVRALVGGYAFEQSQFNRATQAQRQPGSSFKPIVYSAAFDQGFTPASVVVDAPIEFNLPGGKVWRPANYEDKFFGPTTIRTALVKSRNMVTIRVAERIGVRKIIERAKALGLEPDFPENLSICLGATAVSPLNLCEAYTAFARDGSIVVPRMILKIQRAWGEVIYESKPEVRQAVSPQNAYIVMNLLKDVVNFGTGYKAKELKRAIGGKTGTTNNEIDAWFVGTSPYLLTGVWVGFDQLTPMGKLETGGRAACPIFVDYRKQVEYSYPARDFAQPQGVLMVNVNPSSGRIAGPGEESAFVPFKLGTEPSGARDGEPEPTSPAEDLMKQF